jgi:hypothetical protein
MFTIVSTRAYHWRHVSELQPHTHFLNIHCIVLLTPLPK